MLVENLDVKLNHPQGISKKRVFFMIEHKFEALTTSFKDMESKGFMIIPSFLSEEEIKLFKDDYNSKDNNENKNWNVKPISAEVIRRTKEKFNEVIASVNNEVNINANLIWAGWYFSTAGKQKFEWHQDHESYYLFQSHHDYLNFYIPIVKSNRDKSNISVVPFDLLRSKNPDIYEKILGKGAVRYIIRGNKTIVLNDNEGGKYGVLPYDINDIAFTPMLDSGDLLIMRGDVIHKTQDADTTRIAASIRVVNGEHKISKAKLVKGGFNKLLIMIRNREYYEKNIGYYDAMHKDEISIEELVTCREHIVVRTSRTKLGFLLSLLAQKIRVGRVDVPAD